MGGDCFEPSAGTVDIELVNAEILMTVPAVGSEDTRVSAEPGRDVDIPSSSALRVRLGSSYFLVAMPVHMGLNRCGRRRPIDSNSHNLET